MRDKLNAGASGLVGANITKACLDRGYEVRGTLRDHTDPDKAPYLEALAQPGQLSLYSGDMADVGCFDEVLRDCDGVFIASLIPTYTGKDGTPARELDDERGYEEVVRDIPTILKDTVDRLLHH